MRGAVAISLLKNPAGILVAGKFAKRLVRARRTTTRTRFIFPLYMGRFQGAATARGATGRESIPCVDQQGAAGCTGLPVGLRARGPQPTNPPALQLEGGQRVLFFFSLSSLKVERELAAAGMS